MNTHPARIHALSFDVEEHFQVAAFWSEDRRRGWDQYESRVERNVDKILSLLSRHEIHATFFVLGWVALKHPKLVEAIAGAGHEIASHGFGHEMITSQRPDQFREDVRKSKQTPRNTPLIFLSPFSVVRYISDVPNTAYIPR